MFRLTLLPVRTSLDAPEWMAARSLEAQDVGHLVFSKPGSAERKAVWTVYREIDASGRGPDEVPLGTTDETVTLRFTSTKIDVEARPCTFPDPPDTEVQESLRRYLSVALNRIATVMAPLLREIHVWNGVGALPLSVRQLRFATSGGVINSSTPCWYLLVARATLPEIAAIGETFIAALGDADEANQRLIPDLGEVSAAYQYTGESGDPLPSDRYLGAVPVLSYPTEPMMTPVE